MKNALTICGVTLATSVAPIAAQTLTVTNPDYSAEVLFESSPDYTITGVAVDRRDRIYYVENDALFNGSLPTRIWSRIINGGSAGSRTLVHDFGQNVFGSFLLSSGDRLIFAESSANTLYSIDPNSGSVDPLGSALNIYDGAIFDGALYVSQYLNGESNVTKFNLVPDDMSGEALSAGDRILAVGSGFSGPLEFGGGGELLYGASSGGVYRYSAAEVAGAAGESELIADGEHRIIGNSANAYFGPAGGRRIWHTDFSSLNVLDANIPSIIEVATSAEVIGQMDGAEHAVYVAVTDFGAKRSRVFAVVPEPATAAFLASCGAALLSMRQRRLR